MIGCGVRPGVTWPYDPAEDLTTLGDHCDEWVVAPRAFPGPSRVLFTVAASDDRGVDIDDQRRAGRPGTVGPRHGPGPSAGLSDPGQLSRADPVEPVPTGRVRRCLGEQPATGESGHIRQTRRPVGQADHDLGIAVTRVQTPPRPRPEHRAEPYGQAGRLGHVIQHDQPGTRDQTLPFCGHFRGRIRLLASTMTSPSLLENQTGFEHH